MISTQQNYHQIKCKTWVKITQSPVVIVFEIQIKGTHFKETKRGFKVCYYITNQIL